MGHARATAVQRFNRGNFLSLGPISVAHAPSGLVLGAIEEHWKHFATVPLQDSFENSFKSFAVLDPVAAGGVVRPSENWKRSAVRMVDLLLKGMQSTRLD